MLLARKGVHKVLHAWDRPDFRRIFIPQKLIASE